MVQKVHPKGPRVLPPKCEFQKMRSGECSVHILRGPWLGQKLEFSSSFFGRIENTKMSFRN